MPSSQLKPLSKQPLSSVFPHSTKHKPILSNLIPQTYKTSGKKIISSHIHKLQNYLNQLNFMGLFDFSLKSAPANPRADHKQNLSKNDVPQWKKGALVVLTGAVLLNSLSGTALAAGSVADAIEDPIDQQTMEEVFHGAALDTDNAKQVSYTDVNDGDWFKEYVVALSKKGVVKGYAAPDGVEPSFGPSDNVTVSQFAKMYVERTASINQQNTGMDRQDTLDYFNNNAGNIWGGHWAEEYRGAVFEGSTIDNNDFKNPDIELTRGGMLKIISGNFTKNLEDNAEFQKLVEGYGLQNYWGDVKDTDLRNTLYYYAMNGVLKPSDSFRPNDNINRAEVSKIIFNLENSTGFDMNSSKFDITMEKAHSNDPVENRFKVPGMSMHDMFAFSAKIQAYVEGNNFDGEDKVTLGVGADGIVSDSLQGVDGSPVGEWIGGGKSVKDVYANDGFKKIFASSEFKNDMKGTEFYNTFNNNTAAQNQLQDLLENGGGTIYDTYKNLDMYGVGAFVEGNAYTVAANLALQNTNQLTQGILMSMPEVWRTPLLDVMNKAIAQQDPSIIQNLPEFAYDTAKIDSGVKAKLMGVYNDINQFRADSEKIWQNELKGLSDMSFEDFVEDVLFEQRDLVAERMKAGADNISYNNDQNKLPFTVFLSTGYLPDAEGVSKAPSGNQRSGDVFVGTNVEGDYGSSTHKTASYEGIDGKYRQEYVGIGDFIMTAESRNLSYNGFRDYYDAFTHGNNAEHEAYSEEITGEDSGVDNYGWYEKGDLGVVK